MGGLVAGCDGRTSDALASLWRVRRHVPPVGSCVAAVRCRRGLRRGLVCSGAELLCVAWQLVVRADTTVEALCVDASGVPPELVVTTYGYSGRC